MKMSTMETLKGRLVTVGRGGPESKSGKLLAVNKDHIVVHNENDGVIYYNVEHVKSMSIATNDYSDLAPVDPAYVAPSYIQVETLQSVFKGMENRWVQINRGGPDKIEGVLTGIFDDHLVLVSKNEVIAIYNFHIKSISFGTNQDKKNENNSQDKKNENNSQDKKEQNNSNKN